MATETIIYIIIAGAIAVALAVFMYGFRSKQSPALRWTFGILRFVSVFCVLLLLINPKLVSETYRIEKPQLPILIDNSASIAALGQVDNAKTFLEQLQNNPEINEKFDISLFTFGSSVQPLDSLTFSEKNTNISEALKTVDEIFKHTLAPTILLTDGNQTLGSDYEFSSRNFTNPIFPVILGDSAKRIDLKIEQLNTNRYAFLKNEFPVEVILSYSGTASANSELVIRQNGEAIAKRAVVFSERESSQIVNFTLPAAQAGLQKYSAELRPLENEKNTINNKKIFAVEVIDQATNVLIVSDLVHPDLGAMKKAITSNERRTVRFAKPQEASGLLNDYQLVILYQPTRNFASLIKEMSAIEKNALIISGLQTDWRFLNGAQKNFQKEISPQREEVQASLNTNYGSFAVEDIGFDDFPPLYTHFGQLEIKIPHQSMLDQTVQGLATGNAMLATMEISGRREALWDGEGFWRWRARNYINSGSFQGFDDFMGNIVQYLASNKRRNRLEVEAENFYYGNSPIKISAQYFDKNYVFDDRASLEVEVKNTETGNSTVFPMLLRNNFYQVDLSNLPAGDYLYEVSTTDKTVSASGNFTILEFDVESQFLNADIAKLGRVAQQTGGQEYFISQGKDVIQDLLRNENFQNIQKSQQKVLPLIDWKYLLALIVLALAAEWFIRKYNGLV